MGLLGRRWLGAVSLLGLALLYAAVLTLGDVSRFQRGKQVASYLGLIPREESSGGRQKLGAITKQGNRLVRSLLVACRVVELTPLPRLRDRPVRLGFHR